MTLWSHRAQSGWDWVQNFTPGVSRGLANQDSGVGLPDADPLPDARRAFKCRKNRSHKIALHGFGTNHILPNRPQNWIPHPQITLGGKFGPNRTKIGVNKKA